MPPKEVSQGGRKYPKQWSTQVSNLNVARLKLAPHFYSYYSIAFHFFRPLTNAISASDDHNIDAKVNFLGINSHNAKMV